MDDPDQKHNDDHRDPRVYFAAERTMLAWVRTGVALMGFGFVVERFGLFLRELALTRGTELEAHQPGATLWMGTILMLLGVWVNVAATVNHLRFRNRFERGEPFVTPKRGMSIVLSVLLAVLGIGMTIYFIVVSRGA